MAKNMTVRLPDELAAATESLARVEGKSVERDHRGYPVRSDRPASPGSQVQPARAADHRRGPRAARTTREVSVEYLDLADYVGIAAVVTGLDEGSSRKSPSSIWPTRLSTRRPQVSATTTSTRTSSTRERCSSSGSPRTSAARRQQARRVGWRCGTSSMKRTMILECAGCVMRGTVHASSERPSNLTTRRTLEVVTVPHQRCGAQPRRQRPEPPVSRSVPVTG